MSADSRRIIVTESRCGGCSVSAVVAYHQNFPEMRTEDASAELAARRLADHLAAALDNISNASRREEVQIAIDDARAFLDRDGCVHVGRDVAFPGTA